MRVQPKQRKYFYKNCKRTNNGLRRKKKTLLKISSRMQFIIVHSSSSWVCLDSEHLSAVFCVPYFSLSLSRFAVCVYVICVNEKPERTQDFFFYTFAISSSSPSPSLYSSCFSLQFKWKTLSKENEKKKKRTTGYSKRSAFHALAKSVKGKKWCISCPLPEILIARRPVAFPFNSPKPKARKKSSKKHINNTNRYATSNELFWKTCAFQLMLLLIVCLPSSLLSANRLPLRCLRFLASMKSRCLASDQTLVCVCVFVWTTR